MIFWIALSLFVITVACCLEIVIGIRKMTKLVDIQPMEGRSAPKVSVIIPACNEEATIEPALRSVLNIDYPNLEVIVINDRSTDNTGSVIKTLQHEFPKLQFVEIAELPDNWLGKSHAQQAGADHASGEYLLFTDADIHMESSTLRRAIRYMLDNDLAHISLIFENSVPGGLLNALLMDLGAVLLWLLKPWRAKDPDSKYFMGVGAFNLVKSSAYKTVGGHSSFAMHPIDDIMLGKVLKQNNFSQDCLLGNKFIQVAWYNTISELINGVMKNTFALYRYSVLRGVAGVSMVFMLSIFPVWAVVFSTGVTRGLFAAMVIGRLCAFGFGFFEIGLPIRYAVWSLISPYLNCYISVKAILTTIGKNGIDWRGTHYPLSKLKKQPNL